MSKLDKDQIKILAGFGVAIALFVVLFFVLTGEDEQNQNNPQTAMRQSSTLPNVPKKEKKEFTSKLDAVQTKDEGKEREVSLDIFKVEKEEKEEETQEVVEAPVKKQSVPVRRSVPKQTEPIEEKEKAPEFDDFVLATSIAGESSNDLEGSSNVKINAVIHDTQVVKDGQRVTLRVTEAFELNGKRIRSGRFIHSVARFDLNRVHLDFSTLTFDDGSLVSNEGLAVYDATDRKKGIYSEQLSEQEFTGESGEEILDEVETTNTLGGKILKGFAKKKLQEISVQLRDNTKVIIR